MAHSAQLARRHDVEDDMDMSGDCLHELKQLKLVAKDAAIGAHRVADAIEPIGKLAEAILVNGKGWLKFALVIVATTLVSSGSLSPVLSDLVHKLILNH